MPEDAGLDVDFDDPGALDRELARIQGDAAGVVQPKVAEVEVAPGQVVTSDRTIEFLGERFRLADKVGLMPLLKFSAHSDLSTSDPGALAAMYAMLRDCIHPGNPGCGDCEACDPDRCGECRGCARVQAGADEAASPCLVNRPDPMRCKDYDPGDWARFEHHAIDAKAGAEDLLDVISSAIELISGRPTEPRSSSSPGQRATRGGSMGRSSSRARRGSRR